MEGPVMIPVGQPVPLGIKARMFVHSLKCTHCSARFWAVIAMEYSTKALLALSHEDQRVTFRAKCYLAVAQFATRRRIEKMRELGVVPFEDLTQEQQQAAIKELNDAGRRAYEAHQKSLH